MDLPPCRYSLLSQVPQSRKIEQSPHSITMSTLTVRPSSILPSPKLMLWEDTQFLGLSSRSRSPTNRTKKVELPPIRQAIPEIQLHASRETDPVYRYDSIVYPPSPRQGALMTPPDFACSPSQRKRRRLSSDDDNDTKSRENMVPKFYHSSPRHSRNPNVITSPTISVRRTSTFSSTESWTCSAGNNPYIPVQRPTGIRSPPPFDSSSTQSEWRPMLPSLPSLTLDRAPIQAPRARNRWGGNTLEATRSGTQTNPPLATSFEPSPSAQNFPAFIYGYQLPRGQSYSGPSSLPLDSTPFPASHHHPGRPRSGHPYETDINDGIDGKQRKRRGNLPKETTDKLRAWFVAHLQHPYPTEDEKQELMRQTGLQMNQISNWFINARRRQLPAMISNARVESDARSARVGDKIEGASDYGGERDRSAGPQLGDSDGEGSYDDEYDVGLRAAAQGTLKRESI
ncbi:PBX knotted homeobox 2 [Hyphodiscus hymeniophilus]|uniref:PBX knotted homeobox 2 n=1 Tax=Hyphodiscus hymeniophilus TaxID=353542 RepID=A0A9P7AVM9_9HELO|nr:PBX knotted homeobox 2 [Hyphodiscus hymeniophilus]